VTVETNPSDLSEVDVCRDDDNILDTGTVPIIFVPGVMGSRLWIGDDEEWDPDSSTNMIGWAMEDANDAYRLLHANNAGLVKVDNDDYTQAQRDRGWAGVSHTFYGTFIADLQARTFGHYTTPVYVVGYDWRQSNRNSGRYLRRYVQSILNTEGVDRYILVSHSMGGLVTRSFLKDNEELRNKCLGIIHIAQPVHGGVVLVRRLFVGSSMSNDGGVGIASYVFTRILGTNRKDAITIASGMPGPLQLLVTNNYRDRNAAGHPIGWYDYKTFERPNDPYQTWPGEIWDLYASAQSPPGLLPPATESYSPIAAARTDFTTNLGVATTFHRWLGVWKYEEKTWSIYSTGRRVDTRVPFNLPPLSSRMDVISTFDGPPIIIYYGRRADGTEAAVTDPNPEGRGLIVTQTAHSDGTVPLMSAQGLFPGEAHTIARGTDYTTHHQFQVNDPSHEHSAHDGICQHPQTETAVFDIIEHLLGI
jgi:pimeloyl-ACP methyl ester carboxylesterase